MKRPQAQLPLRQISATKTLTAQGALNRKPRNQQMSTPAEPSSQMGSIVPHSAHAARRSHEYHKNTVPRDQLNPNPSVVRANRTGRSFPGL